MKRKLLGRNKEEQRGKENKCEGMQILGKKMWKAMTRKE
jgi:hypothetical protein